MPRQKKLWPYSDFCKSQGPTVAVAAVGKPRVGRVQCPPVPTPTTRGDTSEAYRRKHRGGRGTRLLAGGENLSALRLPALAFRASQVRPPTF